MATITQVIKGSDVETSTFKFYDNVGTPILLSLVDDYQIYVYGLSGTKKVNYFTFAKNPIGNESSIVEVDEYTISFVVNRTQTLKLPLGLIYLEIAAKFPATSEYILSEKKTSKDGYILCEIVDSANPQQML